MESETEPQDAETIRKLLKAMDVEEYDPRVVEQLLSFMYKYTSEVLQDAQAIASHCGLPDGEVGPQDAMLAIQSRAQHSFTAPPPQHVLLKLADERNKMALPEWRIKYGLRIPPDNECLLNPSHQLPPTQEGEIVAGAKVDADAVAARQRSSFNVKQNHVVNINVAETGSPPPSADAISNRPVQVWEPV